jgi:HD-GYP domain-containing protein (c-di-GMP phosphodiesterase class II)
MNMSQNNIPSVKPDFTSENINSPYLSQTFKVWTVGIIFFLVFFQLFNFLIFPQHTLISKELILGIVLLLVGYLWTQELRDRYRLQLMNTDLQNAQQKMETAEVDTISSLILMEEAKDPYVHGHSSRVSKFSLALAAELNFSSDTMETIRRASILHDLGKLVISDEILLKPGKLTEEEWVIIRKHPQIAIDILEPLKFLYLEKKIILHHHERIDGTGYPARLKGKDIPLESRIVAVADTFDSMNSNRIYREPCSKNFILEELQRVSGTQLDASLIATFLTLLEQHPEFWEREMVVKTF